MAKKTAKKTVARKRATRAKKKAPSIVQHVTPSPLPRRKVDGIWSWYAFGTMACLGALSKAELAANGLKND